MRVFAELVALTIAEHGHVGQQQGAIFGETLGFEAIFVNKVECEAAAQQGLIDALRGLVHVVLRMRSVWAGVEELRALADDDADVGDGTRGGEMGVVAGGPLEVVGADFLPAAVFAEAGFGADEVEVGHHAAGEVSFSHMRASSGFLDALRQPGTPVE